MKTIMSLALALFLASCGDHREKEADTFLDGVYREPRTEDAPVEVLYQKPSRSYKEIALIRVNSHGGGDKVIRRLKQETRRKGGYACIVRDQKGHYQDGGVLTYGSDGGDITEAIVIEWTAAAAP